MPRGGARTDETIAGGLGGRRTLSRGMLSVVGEARSATRSTRPHRRRGGWILAFAVAAALGTSGCAGFNEPALQTLTTEPLTRVADPPVTGKTAAFDIMALDQDSQILFISDAADQGVDVFDVSTPPGRYLQTIHLAAVPNGLAFSSQLQRLFTGNDDSTVSVIDTDPNSAHRFTSLATINTNGQGPADLLDYDPTDHKLFVTNPDDGFVSAIDVRRNTVVAQIQNLGALEQPRYDPVDGMIYVAALDSNSIVQIDPRTDKLVRKYSLPVLCLPKGLAIDPATNQGLLGCSNKDDPLTLAWDFGGRRMLGSFDLAGAGDDLIFDTKAQHFYFAADNYTTPEIAVFSTAPIVYLTSVPTSHHSHVLAYDESTRTIYTYDSKFLEAALWAFPDPVAGCYGHEAQRASEGAPRQQTPNCHPGAPSVTTQ